MDYSLSVAAHVSRRSTTVDNTGLSGLDADGSTAHASSAPIEAIDTFTRFDIQLQQSLPQGCQDMVRQVNQAIDARLGPVNETGGESAITLKRIFDAEALTNDDFSYLIADSVAIAVQYGQKGKLCDRLNQVRVRVRVRVRAS